MEPTAPINSRDPLSAPFALSNGSLLSIHDVSPKCYIHRIWTQVGILTKSIMRQPAIPELKSKVPVDVICRSIGILGPIERAEISIEISYKLKFLTSKRIKMFHYRGAKNSSGDWRWLRTSQDN